jgi:hypothetical protein
MVDLWQIADDAATVHHLMSRRRTLSPGSAERL